MNTNLVKAVSTVGWPRPAFSMLQVLGTFRMGKKRALTHILAVLYMGYSKRAGQRLTASRLQPE